MHSTRPKPEDFRRLASLAVPVVSVQVGLMAMGVVDTMIVGRVSATALAGVAVGAVYTFTLAGFGMGVLMALDPLVSQAVGAGDEPAIARALQRGVVLAAALGVVATLVLFPVTPVLTWLGQPAAVVAIATPYVWMQMPSMIAFMLFVVLRQTLQAMGHMRPVVTTIVVSNVVNAVLAWAFVFGELGAPRMGAVGAGLATTMARWTMVLLLPALAWRELAPQLAWRAESLQWGPIARMLRIGLPIGLQYELEFGVFAAVALLMGHLGPVPMSAHQIAINIASLTFMVPLGVSSAASIHVGRAVGAGDEPGARRSALAALATGAAFMSLSAAVLTLAPRLLARAYTPDDQVVALAAALIPIAGVFQVFDGLQVVSIGVLRGAGDTRTPMIVSLLGYWAFALPLSVWLGLGLGLGPRGLWWGLAGGLMVVAALLLARVRRNLWRQLERLRIEEPAAGRGNRGRPDPA